MILSVPTIPAPHVSLSHAQMSNTTISLNSDLTWIVQALQLPASLTNYFWWDPQDVSGNLTNHHHCLPLKAPSYRVLEVPKKIVASVQCTCWCLCPLSVWCLRREYLQVSQKNTAFLQPSPSHSHANSHAEAQRRVLSLLCAPSPKAILLEHLYLKKSLSK